MTNSFENFYVTAPVAMLDVAIDMELFLRIAEDGTTDYMTVNEWCASIGHSTPRTSIDGILFIKGFPFTYAGINEFTTMVGLFGLTVGVEVNVYNSGEAKVLLDTVEWNEANV